MHKRSVRIGSLILLGSTLLMVAIEASQGSALADDDGPSRRAERVAAALEAPTDVAKVSAEARTMTCPADMVEVDGAYCPSVEQRCLEWMDPVTKMRCAKFAPAQGCRSATVYQHFCIDRYEYPNKLGAAPVVAKSWEEARDACGEIGKRLCGDSEWTMACEGEEHLAYPYGNSRDAEACNIDRPYIEADVRAFANPRTREAEIARLWQAEPSGARPACKSAFGVFDMTGNVDEWVVNEKGAPHQSGLKGGHWGPVRNRCRPMTTAHDEKFSFYEIGFRCCAGANAAVQT